MTDENGYIECKRCEGTGRVLWRSVACIAICPVCKGNGKITWLENIFGVKNENKTRGTSSAGPR